MASKRRQPTWPFEQHDELNKQIEVLQAWGNPVELLQVWITENVQSLAGMREMYAARLRIEYRLNVQSEIMRMVQEGELDEELNPKVTSVTFQQEEVHVSN
jgi:hypothetical protein